VIIFDTAEVETPMCLAASANDTPMGLLRDVVDKVAYLFTRVIIFDTAEVETPTCLATSANDTPCVLTNPIAICARTLLA